MAIQEHLEKLKYFYQVAKVGSIKQAAIVLNITQPSLSKSIKVLEEALEKKLFFRLSRGVELTTEGEVLFDYCHTLFSQLDNLEVKLSAPQDPTAGSLKVGTYDSIAIYFWPKFLRYFLKDHPKLNFELTTNRSQAIQSMVEQGELDVGLIVDPKPNKNLKVLKLFEDSFKLYVSKKHKALKEALIYMPDAFLGVQKNKLQARLLTHPMFKHARSYKTSSLESAKELAIQGMGYGLLPSMVAYDAVKQGKLKQVTVEGFSKLGISTHHIGLIYQKNREPHFLLKALLKQLKKHIQVWHQFL